jgi:uncharacterized protein (UPF0276 family)
VSRWYAAAGVTAGLEGVGVGWRRELAADLLAEPAVVSFVEVVAESCYVNAKLRREAVALSRMWPVALHGVKLSLGSGEGIHEDKARQLGALARELRPPVVSEHVAFTRGREREIGHLTPLPRTRAAVAAVARNVARARRWLPDVPLLLENVASTLWWPDAEMDEATFYQEVVAATGCELLLDVSNLWANATNEGLDPVAVLERFPLDRVAMVHLAGGEWEHGFYLDTHAAPVGEPVLALLRALVERRGPVPVLVERDAEFGPFEALRAELGRVREISSGAERVGWEPRAGGTAIAAAVGPDEALASAQEELARALTGLEEPSVEMMVCFGKTALARSRAVLQRKRVDDSLPLVPRTAARGAPARALAMAAVESVPRAPRSAAIADALRIAAAAARDPELAGAGRVDHLILRARFVGPDRNGVVRPRRGPFVGRARLDERRDCWAIKGPGASAVVRLYER